MQSFYRDREIRIRINRVKNLFHFYFILEEQEDNQGNYVEKQEKAFGFETYVTDKPTDHQEGCQFKCLRCVEKSNYNVYFFYEVDSVEKDGKTSEIKLFELNVKSTPNNTTQELNLDWFIYDFNHRKEW